MFLSAVSHFSHPVTEIPLPLFRVHEDELRALHEIGTKTLGPTFGDVVERVVAASAILLWYKPEGGRKLPAVLEAPEVERASEILCPWDNRSPPNGCIQ